MTLSGQPLRRYLVFAELEGGAKAMWNTFCGSYDDLVDAVECGREFVRDNRPEFGWAGAQIVDGSISEIAVEMGQGDSDDVPWIERGFINDNDAVHLTLRFGEFFGSFFQWEASK